MRIKIRGIYSTALTRFFLDRAMRIVSPSKKIAGRFDGEGGIGGEEDYDVSIRDLRSMQGISMLGSREDLELLVSHIQEVFWDSICSRKDIKKAVFKIEFPYYSKTILDEIRNSVLPSLKNHHRLKIIDAEAVDHAEVTELVSKPRDRDEVSARLEETLLWAGLENGSKIDIEHRKPNASRFWLRDGIIEERDTENRNLTLRRSFEGGGYYDGLGLAIEAGDYDVCRITEGAMVYTHSYYRKDGKCIGLYTNFNTGIEFFPDRIRYIDLELDGLKRVDSKAELVDEQEFFDFYNRRYFGERLYNRVLEEAEKLRAEHR